MDQVVKTVSAPFTGDFGEDIEIAKRLIAAHPKVDLRQLMTIAADPQQPESARMATAGGWFNSTVGSIAVDVIPQIVNQSAVQNEFVEISRDSSNLIAIRTVLGGGGGQFCIFSGGTSQTITSSGVVSVSTVNKMAASFTAAGGSIATNGTSGTYGGVTIPGVTTLWVGSGFKNSPANAWIRRLRYWPRSLSATDLQIATT